MYHTLESIFWAQVIKLWADPDKYSDLLVKAIEEKIEVIRNYQKPESKTKAKKTK